MHQRNWLMILRDAFILASFYFPLMQLIDLITFLLPGETFFMLALFVLSALSGLMCFFVLVSADTKTALIKWGLSVPFSLLFWLFLNQTHFTLRLINTLYPGYGELEAGAGFAMLAELFIFSAAQALANLQAVCLSVAPKDQYRWLCGPIRKYVAPALCIIIWSVILYLEYTMPSYETISQYIYT